MSGYSEEGDEADRAYWSDPAHDHESRFPSRGVCGPDDLGIAGPRRMIGSSHVFSRWASIKAERRS